MLIFESVKYKNILSTGNFFTEIFLNKNKSTLVVGNNGAGKSTMLDAICFGLYGKAFRKIKKQQLVNSINKKDAVVELKFSSNSKKYMIRRGIKPNIFEIWCDGVMLNQESTTRDYQEYLEENIIKMNFKTFGQIVVLGSSTFVPFMQLSSLQRREIIEDLLDIQIFTVMNLLLKDRMVSNKEEYNEIKHQNELLHQKIQNAIDKNESIKKIREVAMGDIKIKIADQLTYIDAQQISVDKISTSIDEFLSKILDKPTIEKKLHDIKEISVKFNSKKNQLKNDISFFEQHDICPTCSQDIDTVFKTDTLKVHNETSKSFDVAGVDLDVQRSEAVIRIKKINEIEKDIQSNNLMSSEHRVNIKFAKNSLLQLKEDMDRARQEFEEIDMSKIDVMNTELKDSREIEKTLTDRKQLLSMGVSLLKDGGIKTQIIKQYVPVMNKLINKYLFAMDFFVQFELNESFNETIKSRFRDDFSYESFSEGEKLRIDLALLFTWRAVSRLRNSVSTNLLIMDEIMDSSLDSAGTEEFLKIISELAEDSNIFIISHKGDALHDKFDHMIQFETVKNFSRMIDTE